MPRKTGFGERLQRIMREKNLTQAELARRVWGTMVDERGYTVPKNRQNLSKYLSGKLEPRMSTKRSLADVLDVPLAVLDPNSDPLSRPGSGIHFEDVDRVHVRLEVNLVVPKTAIPEIVQMLGKFAA